VTVKVYSFWVKCAVTLVFLVMVTSTGLVVPVASPVQLAKLQPSAGVAVSSTTSP